MAGDRGVFRLFYLIKDLIGSHFPAAFLAALVETRKDFSRAEIQIADLIRVNNFRPWTIDPGIHVPTDLSINFL